MSALIFSSSSSSPSSPASLIPFSVLWLGGEQVPPLVQTGLVQVNSSLAAFPLLLLLLLFLYFPPLKNSGLWSLGEPGGLLVFPQRPLPDHLRRVTGVFRGRPDATKWGRARCCSGTWINLFPAPSLTRGAKKIRSEIRKKHWASELPGRLDNAQICEQMVYYLTPASFTWFTVGGGGAAVFELTLPSAGGKRNRNTKPSYLTITQADVPERPNMAPEKCLRLLLGQIQPDSGRTEPKKMTKTPPRMWSSVCRVGWWNGGVASTEAAVWIWRRTVCSLDWLDWFLWCCWFLWYFTRHTWRRRWIPWMIQAGHQGRKIQAECGNEAARREERRSEDHRTGIYLRNICRINKSRG